MLHGAFVFVPTKTLAEFASYLLMENDSVMENGSLIAKVSLIVIIAEFSITLPKSSK
mgnify:CR=1 FL=1